jgi:hypothetical protein
MGLAAGSVAEPIATPTETLAEWYADLVRVETKKIIVFTHAKTLFTLVALDVHRHEIRALAQLLLARLQAVLTHLEGSQSEEKVIAQMERGCTYAPTADRRVLGSMNELIRSLKLYLEEKGGIESSDAVELSLRLSEILLGAIDYDKPVDRFRALLQELSL